MGLGLNPKLSAFLSRRLIDRARGYRRQVLEGYDARASFDFERRRDMERLQARALAELLTHAKANVPYYRERLMGEAGIDEDNAREVLKTLPILEKRTVQHLGESLKAEGVEEAFDNATGGSTGAPMTFHVDRERHMAGEASHMWANHLAGWEYGDRVAMLWGADADVRSATARLKSRLRNVIENIRWYNAFDMGEAKMAAYHRAMRTYRPHLLIGYAGSLEIFARYLKDCGASVSYPQKALVSSAEVLTDPARSVIEEVFGKPVFDRYGSREFGPLAAECSAHSGLHVNELDCVLEIDSPDPVTEPGDLIVTYLRNRAMPFIRYRTGDLAVWDDGADCPCGRRTKKLARIVGRCSDTIRTGRGRYIHGEYFTHLLYGVEGVDQFQFVQEERDRYRLLLAGDRTRWAESEKLRIQEEIRGAVGPDADIELVWVDEIPLLPSGKRRFTISRIEQKTSE